MNPPSVSKMKRGLIFWPVIRGRRGLYFFLCVYFFGRPLIANVGHEVLPRPTCFVSTRRLSPSLFSFSLCFYLSFSSWRSTSLFLFTFWERNGFFLWRERDSFRSLLMFWQKKKNKQTKQTKNKRRIGLDADWVIRDWIRISLWLVEAWLSHSLGSFKLTLRLHNQKDKGDLHELLRTYYL